MHLVLTLTLSVVGTSMEVSDVGLLDPPQPVREEATYPSTGISTNDSFCALDPTATTHAYHQGFNAPCGDVDGGNDDDDMGDNCSSAKDNWEVSDDAPGALINPPVPARISYQTCNAPMVHINSLSLPRGVKPFLSIETIQKLMIDSNVVARHHSAAHCSVVR